MMTFSKIEPQRLRVWLEKGIFGEQKRSPGKGKRRRYTFLDTVLACLLRDILDFVEPRSLDIAESGITMMLRGVVWTSIQPSEHPKEQKMWLVLTKQGGRDGFYVCSIERLSDGTPLSYGESRLALVVPLWAIIAKVRDYFKTITNRRKR